VTAVCFAERPDRGLLTVQRKRHQDFPPPLSGGTRIVMDLGRIPVSPEPIGYLDTIRQLAMAPDGTRAVLAYLQPDSQIWMLEAMKD